MSDREKLMQLIGEIQNYGIDSSSISAVCKTSNETLADHLISNGVTVQKWILASEPPKDTCEYWIAYKAGGDYYYSTGYFDGKCWCSVLTHHKIPVTHWMPLPEPPKGE